MSIRVISGLTFFLLAFSVQAADFYYTNRTFKAITFNLQGTPPADILNTESKKLNNIVPGSIKTNSCYALEKKTAFAWGYPSGISAWNAAANYSSSQSNYSGKLFDNVGWVRGTKSAEGNWGAFLWTMQNHLDFKSSETDKYACGSGWVVITNVMVRGLTNYPPMSDQSVDWPDVGDLGWAKSNYPGDNQGEEKSFQVDLTTYFQLALPDISVSPPEAVAAVGGGDVQFTAVGTNIEYGVAWSIIPSGVTSGAAIQAGGYSASVTPGTVPQVYKIRAAVSNCPDFYDEAKLTVCELESIEPDRIANLQEIDDSDFNLKTRTFLVPIAQALEFPIVHVTVRAHLNPNLTEAEVPAGWTLQGGNGSEKLTRTINRSFMAGPSKTEFTFSFDGIDSGFKTTIYVYDAKVGLFADEGDLQNIESGHSWGRYILDSYAQELIDEELREYIKDIGFHPTETADMLELLSGATVPGDVRIGPFAYSGHWPTGWKEYPIRFSALLSALPTVRASDANPPWFNLYNFNCTDYAIRLGEIVNIYTMDPGGVSTPWVFSAWLNSN